MKVVVIGRSLPEQETGLIGIFELQQAQALMRQGCDVAYLFLDYRSIKLLRKIGKIQAKLDGISVYGEYFPIGGIPYQLYDYIKYKRFKKVWKQMVKHVGNPDVVHVHYPLMNTNRQIISFLKEKGIKIVVTEHWTRVLEKRLRINWLEIHKDIMNKADAIIAVSDSLKESMLALAECDREVHVIPNMVADVFRYTSVEKVDEEFVFVSVGRMVECKNFDKLVIAFVDAFHLEPQVKLFLVGDGPELKKIKTLVSSLNANEVILFKGYMKNYEVAELLGQCQSLVSASVLETFGVPWIEAWCTGLPVIGTENNPIKNYFSELNSITFQENDNESLKMALIQMYEKRHSFNRKEIAEKAFHIFSGDAIAIQLLEVYQSVRNRD